MPRTRTAKLSPARQTLDSLSSLIWNGCGGRRPAAGGAAIYSTGLVSINHYVRQLLMSSSISCDCSSCRGLRVRLSAASCGAAGLAKKVRERAIVSFWHNNSKQWRACAMFKKLESPKSPPFGNVLASLLPACVRLGELMVRKVCMCTSGERATAAHGAAHTPSGLLHDLHDILVA